MGLRFFVIPPAKAGGNSAGWNSEARVRRRALAALLQIGAALQMPLSEGHS